MAKKNKKVAEVEVVETEVVETEVIEEPKVKMCSCGEFARAISKSGRLSGLCRRCNVEASKKSRAKNAPSRTFQRNTAINHLHEVVNEDEIDYKLVREIAAELLALSK